MTEPFDWPCPRRDAHKSHRFYSDGLLETCPGVPAHPSTMIGGAHPPD